MRPYTPTPETKHFHIPEIHIPPLLPCIPAVRACIVTARDTVDRQRIYGYESQPALGQIGSVMRKMK